MDNQTHLSKITRGDRAVEDETWIADLLHRVPSGVLATAVLLENQVPQPFLSTLLFVYDESRRAIYVHTARRGRVWNNLQDNERVCFTVHEMGRLLPAKQAMNFSVEYASVVVFGKTCLVDDPLEAGQALQMTLDKYFPHLKPGQDYRPVVDTELQVTAVYRIDISEWSGKKKAVAEEFPGAFIYPFQQV